MTETCEGLHAKLNVVTVTANISALPWSILLSLFPKGRIIAHRIVEQFASIALIHSTNVGQLAYSETGRLKSFFFAEKMGGPLQ
jgi:hypothetical protein